MPNLNVDIEQILAWYGEAMVENRLLRLQVSQLQAQLATPTDRPPGREVEGEQEDGEVH